MMKRIILVWMAAFLTSGMVMAQQARRSDNMPDPKVHAERMTERMAKEYSLDDTQKKQLLEVNMELVEKMRDSPRRQLTDEQRAERKKARDLYNVQLQKIMTNDQYAAYTQKMQEGKGRVKRSRK